MWDTIKQILAKTGGTCIIVEDGKPAFVAIKFEDFQKTLETQPSLFQRMPGTLGEEGLLEKINQEIINWKTKQAESEPEIDLAAEDEDLKIENLPVV